MNKIVFIGIATAIIVSGIFGAYAMVESDTDMVSQDVKDVVSDIKEDASNLDSGFGQVEKDEGVYSP
jgi:hypothetical protein